MDEIKDEKLFFLNITIGQARIKKDKMSATNRVCQFLFFLFSTLRKKKEKKKKKRGFVSKYFLAAAE